MLTIAFYGMVNRPQDQFGDHHDHSLVFMDEGQVLESVELERLTRRKHDDRLPLYIEDLLANSPISLPNKFRVIYVDSFAGRKFCTPSAKICLAKNESDTIFARLKPASGRFLDKNVEILLCSHELAHVGSHLPFYQGFEENSLIVHIDGGASNSNCSIWTYRNRKLRLIHSSWRLKVQTTNFNLNPLTSAILQLPSNSNLSVAGRLMGYASYGNYSPELLSWLKNHKWFQNCKGDFGKFFRLAAMEQGWQGDGFDTRDQFMMDIAACMQHDLEDNVEQVILQFQKQTKCQYLYYSGGVALNIRLNTRLENLGIFDKIFIPPCCNDSGLALGAASLAEFFGHGKLHQHSPFLNTWGLELYRYAPKFSVDNVADRIAHGQVIGIVVGNAEVGPRALGHRSIIASPCDLAIRDKISIKMKRREWYRPVAPLVLRSEADRYFENAGTSNLSPFMLGNYRALPAAVDLMPGVVHIDGTARAQAVDMTSRENQLMVNILYGLQKIGHPACVINTSFNESSEAIVHTFEDALRSGRKLGLDALIMNNELIEGPALASF